MYNLFRFQGKDSPYDRIRGQGPGTCAICEDVEFTNNQLTLNQFKARHTVKNKQQNSVLMFYKIIKSLRGVCS